METTQDVLADQEPVEVLIEDARLVVTLGVKRGVEIIQRILLPVGQTAGIPLRANPRSFDEAYKWMMDQRATYQKEADQLLAEPAAPPEAILPDNTVRLPVLNEGPI